MKMNNHLPQTLVDLLKNQKFDEAKTWLDNFDRNDETEEKNRIKLYEELTQYAYDNHLIKEIVLEVFTPEIRKKIVSLHEDYWVDFMHLLENEAKNLTEKEPKSALKLLEEIISWLNDTVFLEKEEKTMPLVALHKTAAETAAKIPNAYQVKRHYKKAVDAGRFSEDLTVRLLLADVYHELGKLLFDESKSYDAIKYFKKVVNEYENNGLEADPLFMAAVYNNLAIASKMEFYFTDAVKYLKKTLKIYEELAVENPEQYLPFVAMTYNQLGNVYVEKFDVRDDIDTFGVSSFSGFGILSVDRIKTPQTMIQQLNKDEGVKFYRKAEEIFDRLAKDNPGQYLHYLATAKHNLGVIHDEMEQYDEAEKYYKEAIAMREALSRKNPEVFAIDLIVSLLNLLTLYVSEFELNGTMKSLDAARELFEQVKKLVPQLPEGHSMIPSIKSETAYFEKYFDQTRQKDFNDKVNYRIKVNEWSNKIEETMDAREKTKWQKQWVEYLETLLEKYPRHPYFENELKIAYNNLLWYALLSAEKQLSEETLEKFNDRFEPTAEFLVNTGHRALINNDKETAVEKYRTAMKMQTSSKEHVLSLIRKDWQILRLADALQNHADLEYISQKLEKTESKSGN